MRSRSSLAFLAGTATVGLLIAMIQRQLPGTQRLDHSASSDPWIDAAMGLGLHRGDPTLDRLLARDLRFGGLSGTDAQLASEARRLGLTTRSPSARKRLHRRLEDILLDGIPDPSTDDLLAHIVAFPSVAPERSEWQLTYDDGRQIWLSEADLQRRKVDLSDARLGRERRVAPNLDGPDSRAMVAAHWRGLELRRRWAELEEQ